MWVVTGPFDGQVPNEVGFQKSKLLKSGKSYFIGRKSACDLVVNHKKVSHDHGQLIVGEFTPDNVANIDFTSTLRILNSKNKTMRILREGVSDGVIVNPGATETLKHDDKLDIVSGLPLTVQWNRICCFESPGSARTPIPIDGCASLGAVQPFLCVLDYTSHSFSSGVHVVRTLHPDITHHLVPSYALTPAHMTSLLSAAQLVKPEWLSELLALSDLNPRESPRALEHAFALPPEGKFRPAFAAALPPALKTFKTWEPNEARLNMLKGYRFVFAGEKGLEIPAGYRDLVKRGGAEYEAFTVTAGVVRWRRTLVRAKALAEEKNEKVIPVADGDAMELALGVDEWGEIASLAKSFEVEFIPPENILQAIASVDTFYVDSVRTSNSQGQGTLETPLPDVVPNTLSGEPSIAPPHAPWATSPKRATSEQPPPAVASLSELPAPEPEIVEVPIRRRLPPRRANRTSPSPGPAGNAVIVGPSPTPGQPPVPPQGDAAPASTQLPTPISQTRKLPPRRRGIDPSSALLSSSSTNPQAPQSQLSQLDKYKALFDASNPDHAPSSETQHGTPGTSTQGTRVGMLSVVPEEETESQLPAGTSRGTKRSRGDVDGGHDGDVVVADGATDAAPPSADTAGGAHRAKRRALDASSVSQPTPAAPASATTSQTRSTQVQRTGPGTGTTTAAAAAAVAGARAKHTTNTPGSKSLVNADNKLDTDENFLKAVNSTKRGKKLEDDFDREFNQLRIAKPKNVDMPAAGAPATAATGVPDPALAPWDAIDDFGDVGIRGNFMVVVEIDVRRGGSARPAPPARTNNDGHPEWAGRLNFKRFKTKNTVAIERKPTIELVVSEENDYGIGNAYWRSAASGSQSYSDVHDITAAHPPPLPNKSKASRTPTKSRGGRAPALLDEDEDEVVEELGLEEADEMEEQDALVAPPLKPPSTSTRSKASARGKAPAAAKPPSKAKAKATKTTTAATAAKTRTTAAKGNGKGKGKGKGKSSPGRTKKAPAATTRPRTTRGKKSALFLSDDESDDEDEDEDEGGGSGEGEMDEIDEIDELDESAAVVAMELGAVEEEEDVRATVDNDDDERVDAGMTSTLRSTAGTQSRREAMRAAKKRAAAAMGGADDDSDDAVFKGFGSKKRGRVR
ncbi:hypothetical protein BC827DRAFT_1201768 [Russula dissimulans]|nr:hypothetical protein BC827DRAFT_1201768 [Russula dissimulans]